MTQAGHLHEGSAVSASAATSWLPPHYATRASAHLELDLFNTKFVPLPLHSSHAVPLQSQSRHADEFGIEPHILHTLQTEAAQLVMERMVLRPQTLAVIRPQGNNPLAEVLFNTKVSVQFSRCSNHSSHIEGTSTPSLLAVCAGCMATGEESRLVPLKSISPVVFVPVF